MTTSSHWLPRQFIRLTLAIGLGALGQTAGAAPALTNSPAVAFGKLPMHFEANLGQTDGAVQFLARGRGYTLFLTPTEAVLSLRRFEVKPGKRPIKERLRRTKEKYKHASTAVLRMALSQANRYPQVIGLDELEGTVNYCLGNDPSRWLSNLPVYRKVKYHDVYPGVDLVYYGDEGQLEYDFVIAPGSDPAAIALDFTGADQLEVDAEGNLVTLAGVGKLSWRPPVAYQEVDGVRAVVSVAYALKGNARLGFHLGAYDRTKPLVIDPKLSFSTYLGGSSDESALGIAVDSRGFVYVTGYTASTDFPTVGNPKLWTSAEAFVTKLGPGGSNLVFSTYLGGTKNTDSAAVDVGQAIAVDKTTNVYVVGFTESLSFPTTGGYQTSYPSGAADVAFLTKFNPSGSIAYSTYLGGTNDQVAYGVAVDTNGNAYVTGETISDNFPVKNAFQPTYGGSADTNNPTPLDAFVAKFNTKVTGASSLVYSTYLGGNDDDSAQGIAVDSSGNAYITGYSYSTNFPTMANSNQTQTTYFVDAVVAELGPTGSNLLYSTYLGGDDMDIGQAIAVDASRNIYITGYTGSTNFPVTTTAYQTNFGSGYQNVFVAMMNITLPPSNQVVYATYLDGNNFNGDDQGQGIAVDTNGFVYVAGTIGSTDFPVSAGAFQSTFGGGFGDAFVTKLNPAAAGNASLLYSTYLGGDDTDEGFAIAVDLAGNAYVAGDTISTNFTTTAGAFQKTTGGYYDGFVAKIIPAADIAVLQSVSANPVPLGSSYAYTVIVTNSGELDATGVLLTNQLPSLVAYISANSTVGTCSQSGSVVACNVGTLASGSGAVITINVNASTPGLATNGARAFSSQPDGKTNNNVSTLVTALGSIVSVTTTTTNAFEQGAIPGVFRFSRTGYTRTALTVSYATGGTATSGVDYTGLSGSVTFGSYAAAVNVSVTPIDDGIPECPETIVLTLLTNATYAVGSPPAATVTIVDNDLPIVSVVATAPFAYQPGPTNGVFTVSRVGCTTSNLPVNYIISGTASNGVDYTKLSGAVTIPAGALSQTVNVTPVNTTTPSCPKTAILTISTNANYTIGTPTNDTVTIVNNNLPTVTIVATQLNASEAGTNGVFTVYRNGCTTGPLTINYSVGGTAVAGMNYLALPGSATFGAGVTNATITVIPLADAVTESNMTVVVTLTPSANYAVGSPGSATVNIADYTAPPTAQFTGAPTNGLVPFTVTFTDASIGSISSRAWDFGDGTITNLTGPFAGIAHDYTVGGTYTVSLTVYGPLGSATAVRPSYIAAIDVPPQLSVSPAARDFGPVTIGQTRSLTFQVTNLGGGQASGTANVTGPFAVTGGIPYSIVNSQTSTVTVSFIPVADGAFTNDVVFSASNAGSSTNRVTGLGLTPASISVSPLTVDFGFVSTGATAQATLVVTNTGDVAASNGVASVTGGPFTIISGSSFAVSPFGSTNVVVRFAPVTAGGFTNTIIFMTANGGSYTNTLQGGAAVTPVASFTGTPTSGIIPLTVNFTDTSAGTITNRLWNFGDGTTVNVTTSAISHVYFNGGTYSVRLIISGPLGVSTNTLANYITALVPPQLDVTPLNLDFGSVSLGQTNLQNFAVVNTGGQTLTGTAAAFAPFTVTTGSPYSLGAGQTGIVTMAFAPTDVGTFASSVVFGSNGGTRSNNVSGVGMTAGNIGVSPTALNFGVVATGTSTQGAFTVTNIGGTAVSNGTATVTGGPYSIVSGSTFTLAPGASTGVVVSFAPVSAGGFTNSVIFDTANGGSSTNALVGNGAVVPVASFTASPTNGAAPLTVTFTDTSTGTITNRSWNFGDGSDTNTTQTGMVHSYSAKGTYSVSLTVSGPVGVKTNMQVNLVVVVNPPQLVVLPGSLDFGAVTLGQTNTQTLGVINTGDQMLTGTVTALPPFAITAGGSFTVAGGQTGAVSVAFMPVTAGSYNGSVVFSSNSGTRSNNVSGVGLTAGDVGVSPTALDFGVLATGTSTQGVFTVTNTGGTAVSNGTATVTGGSYNIVSGSSFTLAPGASTSVVVSFAPVSAGGFTNSVIFDTANGGSSTNALVGNGAVVPVASFTASPTNGAAPLAVTFTNTSTGTITNRFWSFGDGGTLTTGLKTVFHTYGSAGTNTVRLIVSGPVGVSTNTQANLVVVINPPQLVVTPGSLDFGAVTLGQTNTQTLSAINTGDQMLTGTVTALPPFAITADGSFTVAGGQTGTVGVAFAPTDVGSFAGSVVFSSNGGTRSNNVSGVGLTPGDIGVSPTRLDFGAVVTGMITQGAFTVTNTGGTTVSNGTATVIGGPYSIVSGSAFTLAPGDSTNVVVSFAPVSAGGFTNSVIFDTANGGSSTNALIGSGAVVPVASFTVSPTNGAAPLTVTFTDTSTGTISNRFWNFGDGSNTNTTQTVMVHSYSAKGTYSVSLTVSGPVGVSTNTQANLVVVINSPQLVVTPGSLDFGAVTLGQTNTQTLSAINTGDQMLTGTVTALPPFAITAGGSFTVAGGQTGTVSVAFAPVTAGSYNGNVVFSSNGGTRSNNVSGVGLTAGQIVVSPAAIDFGIVATGTSTQGVFTVTNTGGTTVSNGTATVSGGPYVIVSGSAFTLAGSASTNVVVQFAPFIAGGFTNNVVFGSANGGSSTNALIGSGAMVPVASFTASPTNGAAPLAVTFTNTSTGTITNLFWSFGDGGTLTTGLKTVFHTYGSASTNTVRLIVSGPVGVSTNTQVDLVVVVNPPQLVVTTGSLDFGAVTLGQTNVQMLGVINTGDQVLTGTVTTLPPFAITAGTFFTVAGGRTGMVSVAFTPNAATVFNGSVTFASNGGQQTVPVRGVGLTPAQIGVSPSALNFRTMIVGTSTQGIFVVSNTGGTTMSNGTAVATGGPYTVLSGGTFSIAASSSTNVVVQFAPVAEGGYTNAVIFSTANGGSSTNTLTGSGAVVPVASFTATPTNGAAPLIVTFADTSTGTITNRFWSFGDATATNTAGTSVTHAYAAKGNYGVSLIVSGPVGVSTDAKPNYIVAVNPPQLSVTPAGQDFGAVTIALSLSRQFAILNNGDLPLTGTVATLAPFAVSGAASYIVQPGQTGTVTVTFTPSAAGPVTNQVMFGSNGGASTNTVTGLGLTPGRLVVTPAVLSFGVIPTGNTASGSFLVSNTGGTAVSNGTASVVGSGPFNIGSGAAFSVPGGGSVNVAMQFAPTSGATFTNTVLFSSANGGGATNLVTGGGVLPPVAGFTGAPAAGFGPLAVNFTDSTTGLVTSRFWTFGDGSTSSDVNPSHTYTSSGFYTVVLTAFGPGGSNTLSRIGYVDVYDPQLFVRLAGKYNGLALGNPPTFDNSGLLVLNLAKAATFKGTLTVGGVTRGFTGLFDFSGHGTATVVRTGLSPVLLDLHLDVGTGEQITGTALVAGPQPWSADVLANRSVYSKANPSSLAGRRFTVLLPANTNSPAATPQGDGYGLMTINVSGNVKVTGATGDGQKLAAKSVLSKYGTWPFFQLLYGKTGAILGWVTHTNVVDVSDLEGDLIWSKPAAIGTTLYPEGFTNAVFVIGSEYAAPVPGQRVLHLHDGAGNANVIVGNGNLPAMFSIPVTVTTGNLVQSTNLTLKIAVPTGLFKGSFHNPGNGQLKPFAGVIFQKQNFGSGLFLGSSESGFVNFEPAP